MEDFRFVAILLSQPKHLYNHWPHGECGAEWWKENSNKDMAYTNIWEELRKALYRLSFKIISLEAMLVWYILTLEKSLEE